MLTGFCQDHFGAVRFLYDSSGGSNSSPSSSSSNDTVSSSASKPIHPTTLSGTSSLKNRFPRSSQAFPISKLLSEADAHPEATQATSQKKNEPTVGTRYLKSTEMSVSSGEDFLQLTEETMRSLLNDDSFINEVGLWTSVLALTIGSVRFRALG
jgi:hypothetical protein